MTAGAVNLPPEVEAKLTAAVTLVGRTGAQDFQLRFSDDEQPIVWMAVAQYAVEGDSRAFGDAAAALDPLRAVLRLCEQLVDGGTCTHCGRPTGLEPDHHDDMPLDAFVCWYQYDPELKTFRRACEGDEP